MQIKSYKIPNPSTKQSSSKNVWVLCNAEIQNPAHVSFLEKILSAVKVDLKNDTELVILDSVQSESSVRDVLAQDSAKKLLFFGVVPQHFGLSIEINPYSVVHFRNMAILWSENLEVLQGDKAKKMQLWTALQKLFS